MSVVDLTDVTIYGALVVGPSRHEVTGGHIVAAYRARYPRHLPAWLRKRLFAWLAEPYAPVVTFEATDGLRISDMVVEGPTEDDWPRLFQLAGITKETRA